MKTFARISFVVALVPALLYFLLCAGLFTFQRSLIYFPQPPSNQSLSTRLDLPVADGTVRVATRVRSGPAAVLYFGGNAEDVSQDIPDLSRAFPDRSVFALYYPGYGGSSGSPSQGRIFAYALKLFESVHAEHQDVVVIGRSLGSGVAVWVASQRPVTKLVLVTPFDSLGDAAAQQYPFLPVRLLLRDKFDSGKYAPFITAPTRIIVAERDELIPRSSSDRLRGRFHNGLVSCVIVPGAGHNDIQNSPLYWKAIRGDQAL